MSPRLRIVTGKGGVGKTAVAAAIALAETQRGRNVLLVEMRGRGRAAALLGVPPVGPELRKVRERLHLVDMEPDAAIHEYVLLTLRFEAIYRAVFENRLVRGLIHLVPSLAELVMLGKLWYHERARAGGAPRFDVVVLDAPATGHALALLRTPMTVEATVPAGPLREHARDIRELLTDPHRTVLHIVLTPEEMPVNEAMEIERTAASELGLRMGQTIINQRLAPLPDGALAQLATHAGAPELVGAWRALAMREEKRTAGEAHLARLPPSLFATAASIPRLVTPAFGIAEIHTIAAHLQGLVAT